MLDNLRNKGYELHEVIEEEFKTVSHSLINPIKSYKICKLDFIIECSKTRDSSLLLKIPSKDKPNYIVVDRMYEVVIHVVQ